MAHRTRLAPGAGNFSFPPNPLWASRRFVRSGRGRSGRRGKGRRRWWTVEPGLPAVLFDAPLQLAAIIGTPPSSQVGEQSDSIPLTVRRWRAGCCTTGCLPRAGEGKSVS
ncbi:hypothetical protein PVAP13_2NG529003 [Panicum virgatum]|uniref:Uncharacterized protein n=1 Tax=Panicum virgatum TaxID=38727 RepID=A0A8T0W287_PANVG|nr:hypothetical protein PVAP13_2NG529003 [Panicum virgatum]